MLYLLYTADLPVALGSTIAIYMDDTTIFMAHNNYIETSQRLPESFSYIQRWLKNWRIKTNGIKSVHVTFTTRKEICPLVTLNDLRIFQAEDAKYLRLHLECRLNWTKNIYLPSENNLDYKWEKYTGYSTINHNYRLKILL